MYGKGKFSGDLEFMGLADIFQILGGNSSTGILHMTSHYAEKRGLIYFVNGNPVDAAYGSLHGIDAIYSLFGWCKGVYEFHEGNVHRERVVNSSRMEIVMDALRMLDEGKIRRVGPMSHDASSMVQVVGSGSVSNVAPPVLKGPLVDYSYVVEENRFRDGEKIIKEGAHGSWIWAILDGNVEITRESSRGPITIARLGEGCFVGTFTSLLFTEYSRSATVTAVGEVHLGLLDTLRLSGDYASLSTDFKGLLLSQTSTLKKLTDRAVDLSVKDCKGDGIIKDKESVGEMEFSMNDLFAITGGEICVMGKTPKGYFPLMTLGKEDVFGNVPFMEIGHELPCTSVTASEDLEVSRLDAAMLQREYDRLPVTFKNLIDHSGSCVSVTTRLLCDRQ
ncbi:MAG: cyclic nucleotide-binding domain-containing protein [Deltaproteobacteria bacterium]|nr:cyclic nucleotide-binding domain-containing protein [Deltaproteobacteria bacterium]